MLAKVCTIEEIEWQHDASQGVNDCIRMFLSTFSYLISVLNFLENDKLIAI